MKGSLLLLLLGTLGMCLAFHAAAEEPTPEAPSAASTVNAGPAAVMRPKAFDDTYTIYALAGQRISQALAVLENDVPQGSLQVSGSSWSSNDYGSITVRNTDLLYQVDRYDGQVHYDTFRYTMFNWPDTQTAAEAYVYVTVRPGAPETFIARADTFQFDWSTTAAYHYEFLDVLANDSGKDLRITNVFKGANMIGELGMTTGRVVYMVDQFNGARINDIFHYEVTDAKGRVQKARVVVRVKPQEVPGPMAKPDVYNFQLTRSGNLAPTMLDVLQNDLGTGITMTKYRFSNNNVQGNLRWSSGQKKFVYKVTQYRGAGFTTDFTYTIQDANGLESTTTVTIFVAGNANPGRPVTLKDDVQNLGVPQGGTITWDVYVLDNDTPVNDLKLVGVDKVGPTIGSMTMDSTHTFFYYTVNTDPMRVGDRFTDMFRYTATSKSGARSEASANVTMNMVVTLK